MDRTPGVPVDPGSATVEPILTRQSIGDRMRSVSTARRRLDDALLDLQGVVPYARAVFTVRRVPTARDDVVLNYGMSDAQLRDGLEELIPHSAYFRSVLETPEEIFDFTRVPEFLETDHARAHMLDDDITQGMSFALLIDERIIGSLHFNFAHILGFSDAEYRALEATRLAVQAAAASYVLAGDVGLTRREREVLHLIAEGATNAEIGQVFHLSRHTVNTHVEHVLAKLRVSNRVQAVRVAILTGLV